MAQVLSLAYTLAMRFATIAVLLTISAPLSSQTVPLLSDAQINALSGEISGETAKRNLEGFSRFHRMRGSREFHRAAEQVLSELQKYGYADAHIENLPADGKIFYGTQRSRPAWDADGQHDLSLDVPRRVVVLVRPCADVDEVCRHVGALAVFSQGDRRGVPARDLCRSFAICVELPQRVAVARHGAVGIVSYAPNQRTAWWKQDETLVRWGHLETFSSTPTFAFMISLGEARALRDRLAKGERIRLHAVVRAGDHPGFYEIATATIPGADPAVRDEEIVYSCHLDHPRPGANDNASGCATILEVARTLRKLIEQKRIAPPRRTIRFVWPPEIEGTMALLNGKPELAARIKAAIHLDRVGGGAETKTIFHVTRGPASLPSFVYDVAAKIGAFVDEQSSQYAMTGSARWPLVAPEGGREALRAAFVPLTLGSDHQVYSNSSWGIPTIYLNDWPDRFIHTNADTAAKIDPTKLKRAGFIAAACGLVLANVAAGDAPEIFGIIEEESLRRAADVKAQIRGLSPAESNRQRFQTWYEAEMVRSVSRLFSSPPPPSPSTSRGLLYRRNPAARGGLDAFGYDYLTGHLGSARVEKLELLRFQGLRGAGEDYLYEAVNLANGSRTTTDIRDALSAIYGPVPQDHVDVFLAAAADAGLLLK